MMWTGCDYHESHYRSNSSFLSPLNPCVSCTCTGGLVTCMEVECYVPCDSPVPVPGQCCPVCPGESECVCVCRVPVPRGWSPV